jgi:hypothetical protein
MPVQAMSAVRILWRFGIYMVTLGTGIRIVEEEEEM